jgi:MATE family multidrug resistance protein
MGMRDPDTAHKAAMSGFKMGLMYSSVILLLFMFFPENLADVFRPVSEAGIFLQARSSAVFMIRMASFYVLVEAMMVIFIGALRGAGDTFWTMCLSVSMHWVLVPVLAVLLKVLHLPIETGWTALVMIFFAFSYLVYLRYKQGRWSTIEIVKAAPAPAIVHETFMNNRTVELSVFQG